jgi:hypothetical protein
MAFTETESAFVSNNGDLMFRWMILKKLMVEVSVES